MGFNLSHVDCEDVASEAIEKVVESLHFNDRRQWCQTLLNRSKQLFLGFSKACSHFPDSTVGDSITASRHVRFIANLGDCWGVDATIGSNTS